MEAQSFTNVVNENELPQALIGSAEHGNDCTCLRAAGDSNICCSCCDPVSQIAYQLFLKYFPSVSV